jgi:peptidoglycan/xylan/chitin deacetylase (PgdA/CDA1 family)
MTEPSRQIIPILLYQSVADHPSDFIAPYTVSPVTFRRHIDAVAATGATTLTVSGMQAAFAAGTLPERPVLVTFDDGYRDTLTAAAPALAERGMTSTAYITTGVVGEKSPYH